jgi:hypothetical protein
VFFSPFGSGYSAVKDGYYVNEYFGLTMVVPDVWSVATEDSEKFMREVGAPAEFSPDLILMAERVSHAPGVKSGKDFLLHTTHMLEKSPLPYRMTRKTHSTQLDEREGYRVEYVIDQPRTKIKQSYLATRHGDYDLIAILSGGTEEQMQNLEDLALTIKL